MDYNFPVNNITIQLFYKEDINPYDWATVRKPVFEKTLPIGEVGPGPDFQYNWYLNSNTKEGFKQPLVLDRKYKFIIYGDGKNVRSNPDFKCYSDGDIHPGSSNEFYIVNNNEIDKKYYEPIEIEYDARMTANISLIMTFIISMAVILYHH